MLTYKFVNDDEMFRSISNYNIIVIYNNDSGLDLHDVGKYAVVIIGEYDKVWEMDYIINRLRHIMENHTSFTSICIDSILDSWTPIIKMALDELKGDR